MEHQEETFEEQCTAYVLGSLNTEEALEFERGIPTFGASQREYLAQMNQVTLHLPLLAEIYEPPSHVKVNILQAILPKPEPKPTTWQRFVQRFGLNQPVAAWAVACLFIVGTVGLSIMTGSQLAAIESKDSHIQHLRGELNQTKQQADTLTSQKQALNKQLKSTKTKLRLAQLTIAKQSDLISVLRGRVVKLITMGGGKGKYKRTYGRVLWSLDQQKAVVQLANLPNVDDNRSIQLWFIPRRKKPISAGVYPPNANTSDFYKIEKKYIPKRRKRRRRRRRLRRKKPLGLFAVTIEKKGGAKQPTMTPIMLGKIRL